MSKIDELIGELCLNGVEFRELGEVATFYRGKALSKSDKGTGDTPIILYGELYTTYGNYINEIVSFCADVKAKKGTEINSGDIVMPITSTTKEAQIGKASALQIDSHVYLGGDAIALRHEQEPGYLVHLLNSAWFEYFKMQHRTGTTVSHLSPKGIAKIKIPIPPLEVQKEIVNILDKFTQLEVELSAELKARRKQYEYYRNQLLTFDESREDVRWLTLGDVATIKSGKNKNRKPEAEYPVFGSTGIIGYSDKYTYEGEVLLVARVGAYAGQVNRVNGRYDVSDNTLMIKLVDSCSYDYFYHLLVNMDLNQYASGGGQPLVTAGKLKELRVPAPEPNEQNRIAEILDQFHKLTNDISEGLPAEINARRQQYEYYRTKLLTFQELAA